ncbi:hypothetical protein BDC45DRAFT_567609 [Circinella umbellata]|nr:hypothetical protein BDC45DRAFT_567609 [Circinella umbellata]
MDLQLNTAKSDLSLQSGITDGDRAIQVIKELQNMNITDLEGEKPRIEWIYKRADEISCYEKGTQQLEQDVEKYLPTWLLRIQSTWPTKQDKAQALVNQAQQNLEQLKGLNREISEYVFLREMEC